MSFSDNILIGRFTLTAGISALIQIILLTLMFTVSRSPFGTTSDYFYVMIPLLILPLFLAIRKFQGGQISNISQVIQIIGIIGILIASLAQVILLLKIIDFKQSIWGNSIGVGLIGILILAFALGNLDNSGLPDSFKWFGVILGVVMAIGIPAVFFFIDEFFALSHSGGLDWASVNLLFYPAVLAGVLTQIGLPVWLIWAAQLILNGNLKLMG
jgi:hypothetical protein